MKGASRLRDKIFISHSSPEDNEFTRWLALQLIKEGYPVWCDLTKLIGGEDFWKDIQAAIRERTVKFLYVLSKNSNTKDGPLLELATARSVQRSENLKDFVIPLAIDDLQAIDYNIELHRLNSITFAESWAKGFNTLIEKLEREGVGKSPSLGANIVASWWRGQYSSERGLLRRDEELLSSWFQLTTRPPDIYYHILWETPATAADEDTEPAWPVYLYKNGLMSFAPREELKDFRLKGASIVDTHRFSVQNLLTGKHEVDFMDARTAGNVVVNLLEQAWRQALVVHGLHAHELANNNFCYYFTKGQIENDKIRYTSVEGEKAKRAIIGFRKFKKPDGTFRIRYWHYAVSARILLYPEHVLSVKSHVLFSDDGLNIWESDGRLHRARMSQCKDWWNDDWRDRMLAVMEWLTAGHEHIQIPLGGDQSLEISPRPVTMISPVTYEPPSKNIASDSPTAEEDDDIIDEEEDLYGDEEDD